MNVLITGASGFLGKIISENLKEQKLMTISLGTNPSNDFVCNLVSAENLVFDLSFDLVVHCAGKAHMLPKTSEEQSAFFEVNVKGTENLLKALDNSQVLPKSFIFISTVAVYGKEEGELINEATPLLAKDPYGLSKIQAEKIIQEWCNKNNIVCTILRLPLIAGLNPPGNLGVMIKAIEKGYYFNIAGGVASKSMVLASDVAKIIPAVAKIGGIYNLTDGRHPTFSELSKAIALQINRPGPNNLPLWIAQLMALTGNLLGKNAPITSEKLKKIVSDLTFDDKKARKELGWDPKSVLENLNINRNIKELPHNK